MSVFIANKSSQTVHVFAIPYSGIQKDFLGTILPGNKLPLTTTTGLEELGIADDRNGKIVSRIDWSGGLLGDATDAKTGKDFPVFDNIIIYADPFGTLMMDFESQCDARRLKRSPLWDSIWSHF